MMTEQEHNNVQWRKVKLGEVGEIISGGTPSTTNETFWDGDVLFVTPLDLGRKNKIDSTLRTISELGVKNSSANRIKAHSLAISTRAPIGLMSIVNQDFTTNQGCKSIQFYDSYDSEFFYYHLSYNVEKIQRYGQGTTFMEISKTDFSNLEFTVPDLSAQRRIAAILSSADKVIASTQKVIDKLKQIKQGMMEDLLKPKEGWKMVKLGEVGKISMCKRVFSFETSTEGEIPFYKIGTFGKDADAFISRQLYEEYKSKFSYPKVGDILISASGTIGRTVVYDGEPAYFQDSNIIWIDNDETIVLNQFLYYLYKTITWNLEGSTIARLYNDNFNKIEISVPYKNDKPDLAEQRRIASILSGIDAKIATEEKVLEKYEKVKKGLMERMLEEEYL